MYVLDTNILVAALWSRSGASFVILERMVECRLAYVVSVALMLEYEAVLKRAQMREASWASDAELDIVLDTIVANAVRVMPIRTRLRPTLPDAADEMVLECAVQSGAEAIVTMNHRDFVAAQALFRIDILTPGGLLARLQKKESGYE